MEPGDIKPGSVIAVPSGADLMRERPYRLLVKRVSPTRAGQDMVTIEGQRLRADGGPVRRRNTMGWVVWIYPEQCTQIEATKGPLCSLHGCYEHARWRTDPYPGSRESIFCDDHKYLGDNPKRIVFGAGSRRRKKATPKVKTN